MKKIHTSIRVTELQTVSKTIITYYKNESSLADDLFLKENFSTLENLQDKMTDSIHNDKIESNLAELDTVRDKFLSSLGTALEGYAVLPVPNLQENAQKALTVFNNYGKKIASESFASESALIDGLLLDIQKEEIKACTKELAGIDTIIADLQNAQNDFSKNYAEYTATNANKATSATELKKQILMQLNNSILPYIDGMCIAQKEKYGNFAKNVEAEIDKINSIIKTRKTKGSNWFRLFVKNQFK